MTGRHVAAIILLVVGAAIAGLTLINVLAFNKEVNLPIVIMGVANVVLGALLLRMNTMASDK